MEKPQKRPIRATEDLLTMEIGVNRQAGPYGSLEIVESLPRGDYPIYYYWPLNKDGALDAAQLDDLTAVLVRDVGLAVATRVTVQRELFRSPLGSP